jgi:maltooligosyltrehalose trehalohydrolase
LARLVRNGRRAELAQFPSLGSPEVQESLADPGLSSTFEACKLNFAERATNAPTYALHRDLLAMRKTDAVFRLAQSRGGVDGFVLDASAFGIRLFGGEAGDRLLLVNLGRQLELPSIADPLFAPPRHTAWQKVWSSNDIAYGGDGTPELETERGMTIPPECTVVLRSNPS